VKFLLLYNIDLQYFINNLPIPHIKGTQIEIMNFICNYKSKKGGDMVYDSSKMPSA